MNEFINSIGMKRPSALVIFIAACSGPAAGHCFFLKLNRTGITRLSSIAILAFGCVTLPQAVKAINIESIILLFALMVIASQLHYAGFYGWRTTRLLRPLIDRPAIFRYGAPTALLSMLIPVGWLTIK